MPTRRRTLASLAGASLAGLAGAAPGARAQEPYPTRPIKIIVPYAPAGATDIVARVVGEEMRRTLGQPLIVENRPGASGVLAIETMARARPDGYTVMVGNVSTNAITPILFRSRMNMDYERDVVPVARLADLPGLVLVTATNFAPRTLPEFVAYARANPGRINYGSVGVGSYPQFDALMLGKRAGLDMVHVPMPGGAGPIVTEMLTGSIHFAILNVATTAAMVREGRLRPLAAVSDTRLPEYPDVPTLAEAGYPGVGTTAWQAMFAPAGTPRDVLLALQRAAGEALRAEPVAEAFRRQGLRALPPLSLEEMRAWMTTELATWRRTVAEANVDVG